jgi:hypothetical protein
MAKNADEQKTARKTVITLYVLIGVLTILPFILLALASKK